MPEMNKKENIALYDKYKLIKKKIIVLYDLRWKMGWEEPLLFFIHIFLVICLIDFDSVLIIIFFFTCIFFKIKKI